MLGFVEPRRVVVMKKRERLSTAYAPAPSRRHHEPNGGIDWGVHPLPSRTQEHRGAADRFRVDRRYVTVLVCRNGLLMARLRQLGRIRNHTRVSILELDD